jgi:micrococcal nuclease
VTTTPPTRNCDPSYPDFCIPPPPPDLDCPDIASKDFAVLPPDPHGFDADSDGVGCES